MPILQVGEGVTQVFPGFERPYTIIRVYSDWHILIQRDRATLISDNERAGNAHYVFESNPFGDVLNITRRKEDGQEVWRIMGKSTGSTFEFGVRRMYDDPSS